MNTRRYITGPKGDTGATGATGPQGPAGADLSDEVDALEAAVASLPAQYAPVGVEALADIPGLGMDVGTPAGLCSSNVTPYSQRQVMVMFRPRLYITVNGVSFASDSTAAAATPTTVQFSLYAVTAGDQAFPLAQCSNNTATFASSMTVYGQTFNSTWADSVTLHPDRLYAVSLLIDSATTLPTLSGGPALRTSMQLRHQAKRTGPATSLVDVWADTWAWLPNVPWANVTPGGTTNLARTAVLLGDSFFGSYPQWFGRGNAQGGGRLHPLKNAGVGSETLAQMLARWGTDVSPYNPELVVLAGGVNDVFAEGATSATIQSRYEGIIAQAATDGVKLLICTPSSNTSANAGQKTVLGQVRAYLLALSEPNVTVVDTGVTLTTGDGVTADAAKLVDAVHPNASGITAMANALDDAIAAIS